jgi:NhaP-type Na+/H+ or K+/H+ antiporter
MDADQNLQSIIFGESIFNDAIAIVMYTSVMKAGNTTVSAS